MRRPTRTSARAFLPLATVVSLLLLVPSGETATSRAERARLGQQQYERAEKLRADLQGTPAAERKEADYLKVIQLYRRVYDIAPFSGTAAHALAAAAETYHEMGKHLGEKYVQEAVATYRFLLKEYPTNRAAEDGLFTIAQIQRTDLKDAKAAQATFTEFLAKYPGSRHGGRARAALEEIKKLEAAAASRPKAPAPAAAPAAARPAAAKRAQVRNLRHWNAKDHTRVVVDIDAEVQFQGGRIENPDRIFFDLYNTELSSILEGKTFDLAAGLLKRIRIAENRSGVTRVVLEVNQADTYSVFSLPNPFRLVVDIRSAAKAAPAAAETAAAKPAAAPARPASDSGATAVVLPQPPPAAKPTQDGSQTLTRALGLKINRVVLDPGHGGHDTGTIGPTGFMEKDLALDIARRLAKLLEALGAETVFTREDDSFVPLENRTALANQKQADLFVSIHANSSRDSRVRGVETYFLNLTGDEDALELAARENALSQKSLHELQDLVRQITSNEKLEESRELAGALQEHLHREMLKADRRTRDRGVRHAPFVVLIGASMPSVLTEIAFLSNPEDEQLLKNPAGRQKVAGALFHGLSEYLKNLNSTAVARAAEKPGPSE